MGVRGHFSTPGVVVLLSTSALTLCTPKLQALQASLMVLHILLFSIAFLRLFESLIIFFAHIRAARDLLKVTQGLRQVSHVHRVRRAVGLIFRFGLTVRLLLLFSLHLLLHDKLCLYLCLLELLLASVNELGKNSAFGACSLASIFGSVS